MNPVDRYDVEHMIRAACEERDQAAETELDRQTEKEERWGLWVWEELDEGCRT